MPSSPPHGCSPAACGIPGIRPRAASPRSLSGRPPHAPLFGWAGTHTVAAGDVDLICTGEIVQHNLEHDGYRNVSYLKRAFAIEVEDYDDKEKMLHTIFEKSRVSDTELFALDVNVAIQLLSSFDGTVVYPKSETKEEIFDEATDNSKSKLIPDGVYSRDELFFC